MKKICKGNVALIIVFALLAGSFVGAQEVAEPVVLDTFVVQGKKVRNNPEKFAPTIADLLELSPEELVERTRGLVGNAELFAQGLALANENIVAIKVSDDYLHMKHKVPARLFGFINIEYKVRGSVDISNTGNRGTIEVKTPWWRFLTRDAFSKTELAGSLARLRNERQLTFLVFDDQGQLVIEYLSVLSDGFQDIFADAWTVLK